MKRLVMLAVLGAFVFGMAATASAADIKATGDWKFEAYWNGMNFNDHDDADEFTVVQRLRTKFEFVANENLKGVLHTEVGKSYWGKDVQSDSNINSFEIMAGYIDFNWPGTAQNIKVGHFGVALPGAVGGSSMIHDDETPSVVISGPITDVVGYSFGWHRLEKEVKQGKELDPGPPAVYKKLTATNDHFDAISMGLPLNFDGVKLSPFFMYAYSGENSSFGEDAKVWWAGTSFEMTMFDPFVFKADFNYGHADADDMDEARKGWYLGLSGEYTGLDFMTPELFFAWTSGDDDDDEAGQGQMPMISPDWAVGSFWFGGDWGLDASIDADAEALGFWTLGVSLKDISFVEGLSHTVHVLYVKGTNDEDNITADTDLTYLGEDDSLFEIDLNTQYSIYDELTAFVELGWISADWDERNPDEDEAWKVSTGLQYKF